MDYGGGGGGKGYVGPSQILGWPVPLPPPPSSYAYAQRIKFHKIANFTFCLFRCYQAGLRLDPLKLFAPVELPVPSGTPMISPHISWDHSHTWNVPRPSNAKKDVMRGTTFEIDLSKDSEDRFLIDHKVEGRIVFPAAGYIVLVWRAIANREGKSIEEVPVHFEDFTIYRATMMSTESKHIYMTVLVFYCQAQNVATTLNQHCFNAMALNQS